MSAGGAGGNGSIVVVHPGDRNTFDDVLTCATPDGVDETNPEALEIWKRRAIGIAKQYCWKQYANPPFDLEFGRADVLVTGDPAAVEAFQPGDGCPTCAEGTATAVTYLREHPETSITQVNISVTELW